MGPPEDVFEHGDVFAHFRPAALARLLQRWAASYGRGLSERAHAQSSAAPLLFRFLLALALPPPLRGGSCALGLHCPPCNFKPPVYSQLEFVPVSAAPLGGGLGGAAARDML